MSTKLGKIQKVNFGIGGYQDAMLGIGFVLGGEAWGVHTPWEGTWSDGPSEYAKWTKEDQIKLLGETMLKINDWMKAAKVNDVMKLEGKPVECEFDGMCLKSWRILTEVL